MKKTLTDTEKVATLTGAIGRADRELNLILEPMDHRTSERLLTVCRRVRKILRRALEKVCDAQAAAGASACTDTVLGSARGPLTDREDQTGSVSRAAGGSTEKGERHGKA